MVPEDMTPQERLRAYRLKRRAEQSRQPSDTSTAGSHERLPMFVVQRHDARNLHFDMRLEIDGVLVSWAVPKGPSLNPSDKRLAHRTEDHPMEYLDFEGRIDEGYGSGTVIVWDIGRYENLTEIGGRPVAAAEALALGHIKVELHGRKLTGAFALTHTRMGGDEANWMLVKVDVAAADRRRRPAATQEESVLTGRTDSDLEPH